MFKMQSSGNIERVWNLDFLSHGLSRGTEHAEVWCLSVQCGLVGNGDERCLAFLISGLVVLMGVAAPLIAALGDSS